MVNNIKNNFSKVDSAHRTIIIDSLSQKERRELLQILNNDQETVKTNKKATELFDKIENLKNSKLKITKDSNRRSIIAILNVNLRNALDELSYFFGFLTTNKTQQLASRSLIFSNIPAGKNEEPVYLEGLITILDNARKTNPGKVINLKDVLREQGFSLTIAYYSFDRNDIFSFVDLNDITFYQCEFDWCHFSDLTLSGVRFNDCKFSNVSFLNTTINKCNFATCELQEVMFTGTKIGEAKFSACSIISSNFEDASIVNTTFLNSVLPATHFLEASVENSNFIECNLEDTVFFGTLNNFSVDEQSKNTARITGPITAMLVDSENRGITTPKSYMKLDQSAHTIPIRVALKTKKTPLENVNAEIQTALKKTDRSSEETIPQQLIKNITDKPDSYPESIKILKKSEKLAAEIDSFYLPGGEDVPPALYGQEEEEQTEWGNDYRRSILELGIIHQSFNKGIPLMAVCRGFQMSNVYFGAQLIQDLKGHKGVQRLQLVNASQKGLYSNFKKSIYSAVFHHQAVSIENGPTEHLDSSVIYQDLIKASEPKYSGATPMILLQFHPEFHKSSTANNISLEFVDFGLNNLLSKENEGFWGILHDSAKAYRIKKIALSKIIVQSVIPREMQQHEPDLRSIEKKIPTKSLSNRSAAIKNLEEEKAKAFEIFKIQYYNKRDSLFQTFIKNINLANLYFKPLSDHELNQFSEERDIILAALKYNENFANQLGEKKLNHLMSIIKKINPALHIELSLIKHLNSATDQN